MNLAANLAGDLDLDERMSDPERTVFGQDMPQVTEEFAAAKVDLWCAWTALTAAAQQLRKRAGLPADAPVLRALDRATGPAAERAAAEFLAAATRFEGARVALAQARMR